MAHHEQPMPTQERLLGDLRQVIENAEDLLKHTNHYIGGVHAGARAKLAQALEAANEELARFEDAQISRMIVATHAANEAYGDATGEARLLRAALCALRTADGRFGEGCPSTGSPSNPTRGPCRWPPRLRQVLTEKAPLRELFAFFWRRRWDSNPRYRYKPYASLAGMCLRPLGHVSNQYQRFRQR